MLTAVPPTLLAVMLKELEPEPMAPGLIGIRFSDNASWSRWVIEELTVLYASSCMKFHSIRLKPIRIRMMKNRAPNIVLIPFFARTSLR